MTLAVSRPPPRGPFRSSAGAAAALASKWRHAAWPRAATSLPWGPIASTRAEATMTPSAPARARARTWAGFETPNPTATGTGETERIAATSRRTVGGNDDRAPVTPTSDTQYRNPRVRAAIRPRRSGGVVGATR